MFDYTVAAFAPVLLAAVSATMLSQTVFIRLLRTSFRWSARLPLWSRPVVAGLIVGVIGMSVPEVMGIGYDAVNRLILGEPVLVLGAAIGALFAHAAHTWGSSPQI